MSSQQPFDGTTLPLNITMVAVDKDKNSAHAFRWATDHIDNSVIIAVHVKHKNIPHQGTNVCPPDEDDVAQVFSHLRPMCNPKVVKLKEAVIDDSDIIRGILEYAQRNHIQSIVIGAPSSSKNFLASWSLSIRTGSKLSAGTQTQTPRSGSSNKRSEGTPVREKTRSSTSSNQSMDNFALSINRGQSLSISGRSNCSESLKCGSMDVTKHNLELSFASDHSQSSGETEAEMKRLRMKLKQTLDMYNSAYKETISAQKKAKEISQWKVREARMFEEVRLSEEAALAMAEKEKAKGKAALEAAEGAMKVAEMEARRRLLAEMMAKREAEEKDRALTALADNDFRYRKYTIQDIETATQEFSPSLKIGEGGYGPVFKGQLDHTPVAIKILSPDASEGRKQFQQEVEVLSSIRHPNMVILLGACPEFGCLVYEYMDNGSLEDRLLRKNNTPPIPWWKRFEIAAEIATALLFLHQAKPEPLVHRDLKPANILLDRNFVSKISDVGLARLVPPSVADTVTQYYMTKAAGTFCYIDPEYQQTGKLTTKSDIYSLGIMLLQIITVKPPMGLSHHVKRAIDKGIFLDMLDPAVTDWPVEEALAFAKLALSCAELSKKDRPDLASVVVPELNRLRDFGYTFIE